MKRWIALAVALVLALACVAEASAEAGGRALREGKYVIGEDIEPGTYTLTCTATAGEQMNDAYGSLGGALDALEGGSGVGALFGMLGGMAEDYVDMTVEIIGDYGDVLRSYSMKTGDTLTVTLKEGTALRIADGSCRIAAER